MESRQIIQSVLISLVIGLVLFIVNTFYDKLQSLEGEIHQLKEKANPYDLMPATQAAGHVAEQPTEKQTPCGCGGHS